MSQTHYRVYVEHDTGGGVWEDHSDTGKTAGDVREHEIGPLDDGELYRVTMEVWDNVDFKSDPVTHQLSVGYVDPDAPVLEFQTTEDAALRVLISNTDVTKHHIYRRVKPPDREWMYGTHFDETDRFTHGQLLEDHPRDWRELGAGSAGWTVDTENELAWADGAGHAIARFRVPTLNMRVGAKMNSGILGVMCNVPYDLPRDGYEFRYNEDTGACRLYRWDNDIVTLMAEDTRSRPANRDWFYIEVEREGTEIRGYLHGRLVVSATDSGTTWDNYFGGFRSAVDGQQAKYFHVKALYQPIEVEEKYIAVIEGTQYDDYNVAPNTEYEYKVVADDGFGLTTESLWTG